MFIFKWSSIILLKDVQYSGFRHLMFSAHQEQKVFNIFLQIGLFYCKNQHKKMWGRPKSAPFVLLCFLALCISQSISEGVPRTPCRVLPRHGKLYVWKLRKALHRKPFKPLIVISNMCISTKAPIKRHNIWLLSIANFSSTSCRMHSQKYESSI